jgi:hypothetical protein
MKESNATKLSKKMYPLFLFLKKLNFITFLPGETIFIG